MPKSTKQKKVQAAASRTPGSGKHLCPCRSLASPSPLPRLSDQPYEGLDAADHVLVIREPADRLLQLAAGCRQALADLPHFRLALEGLAGERLAQLLQARF